MVTFTTICYIGINLLTLLRWLRDIPRVVTEVTVNQPYTREKGFHIGALFFKNKLIKIWDFRKK